MSGMPILNIFMGTPQKSLLTDWQHMDVQNIYVSNTNIQIIPCHTAWSKAPYVAW